MRHKCEYVDPHSGLGAVTFVVGNQQVTRDMRIQRPLGGAEV